MKIDIKKILLLISSILLFFTIIEYSLRINAISLSNISQAIFNPSFFIFSLLYFFTFLLITYILPKKKAIRFSTIIHTLYILLFITNYLLLNIRKVPLSISLLIFYKEAINYINFIKEEINMSFIIIVLLLIVLTINNIKKIYEFKNNQARVNKKVVISFSLIISILFIISQLSLNLKLAESSPYNIKFYYNHHITTSNSLIALGLTEYINRDVFLTLKSNFYSKEEESLENIKELQEKYHIDSDKNEYTGIFKNKNLIMIMLESMDNYVINEKNTPTLWSLKNEGFDFTSRYNYVPSGGSTIYTEYTSMTGLYYDKDNINKIEKKDYIYSLPNMFKKNDYVTQSMHENAGSYYNRTLYHKKYNFDYSYFLKDMSKEVIPYTDTQIVDNDKYYDKIIPKNVDKYMSFIITISAHGPYNETNSECKGMENDTECFKMLAKRTDDFLEHLINRLKEDNLMKDTVLVLYTDHQSYAYDYEENYLNSLKTIDNNHSIKSIPFIVYAENIEHKTFDYILVNDVDILPTILNMFDIKYNPNNYIGVDVFSKSHKNLIIFDDYCWYDGKYYSLNTNSKEYKNYKENDNYVMYKMKLNSLYIKNGN